MSFDDVFERPGRRGRGAKQKPNGKTHQRAFESEHDRRFGDFECRHCRRIVSADARLSGVNHRNHCPYCLWSRHVDLHQPGDRLSACKGGMRPIGLAFKQQHKRYLSAQRGELMLVHRCVACGAVSLNRGAADDNPALLWDVFAASLAEPPDLPAGVTLAAGADAACLQSRLFGLRPELQAA
jgi:hypothetical protein